MNSISKIALGVALGGAVALFVGPIKLIIGGVLVAAGAYAWERFVAPLF